jgi:hypothetical protein
MTDNIFLILLLLFISTIALMLSSIGGERKYIDRKYLLDKNIDGMTFFIANTRFRMWMGRLIIAALACTFSIILLINNMKIITGIDLSYIVILVVLITFIIMMYSELDSEDKFIKKYPKR